ncbi:MAG: flagellar biosynthetic protein FliO [Acidobacteriota bacterium]|nr:flagellar biosynthetic protein FliO [Acidobacteriota bacterium]
MEIVQQMMAIGAVLAALGGAVWLLRNKRIPRKGSRMAVLERLTLTPQHTLCLVRVGEETVLIGTSPSTCQILNDRPKPV